MIVAPLPAACSTSAETAAMLSVSASRLRCSCSAATVIVSMRAELGARPGEVHLVALAEQQGHAVALAAQARRQHPHALRPVLRVLRIGVDLAPGDEVETVNVHQLDHVAFAQVALAAVAHGIGRVLEHAMFLDAEQAAGPEHSPDRG